MEFYRAEILMENLKNFNDEQEGRRKKDEDENGSFNTSRAHSDASRMMKDAQKSLPNFNMPNFNMPNFSMPNLKF